MRKLFACILFSILNIVVLSQNTFRSTPQLGVAYPLPGGTIVSAKNNNGIHFGNHFDFLVGDGKFRFGVGGYVGQLMAFSVGDYKEVAQQLAEKYRFNTATIQYSESPFRSTSFLFGPIADWKTGKLSTLFWAKAGYGFNEPGRFSAIARENNLLNTLYKNDATDEKNGVAYNFGSGIRYTINDFAGLQFSAAYYNSKNELVNYYYERERGTAPQVFTANNQFIQASVGVQLSISGSKKGYDKYKELASEKINTREIKQSQGRTSVSNDPDVLVLVPQTIQLLEIANITAHNIRSVNNYLTAFAFNSDAGIKISQCSNAEPTPLSSRPLQLMNTNNRRKHDIITNEDGSFSVKNIESGLYRVIMNNDSTLISIDNVSGDPNYRLASENDACSNTTCNIVLSEGKIYAEIIRVRDPHSGQATGKSSSNTPRNIETGKIQAMTVINQSFDLNYDNVVSMNGKVYAEVKTARDAGSGLATGRTAFTGDLDGDGVTDQIIQHLPDKDSDGDGVAKWNNNPYSEDAQRFMVAGSNGNNTTLLIPSLLEVSQSLITPGEYPGTNFPVILAVKATKSRSNIQNNRVKPDNNLSSPSNPTPQIDAVKATKSRSNIQNNRVSFSNNQSDSSGINPPIDAVKATKSRSNIQNNRIASGNTNLEITQIRRITCNTGYCTLEAVVTVDGVSYNAIVNGKTSHETLKNSIGNIR